MNLKKIKQILLILTIPLIFAMNQAHAGFFFEPEFGRSIGRLSQGQTRTDLTGKVSYLGLNAGLSYGWVWLGATYMRDSLDLPDEGGPIVDISSLGLTLGLQVPLIAIRLFGTYYLLDKVKWNGSLNPLTLGTTSGIVDRGEFKGKGYRVGLGIRVAANFTISVQYFEHNYDKLDGATAGTGFVSVGDPSPDIVVRGTAIGF